MSVARGRVRLYLSEHKGDARPNTLIHLNVADIDAVAAEFGIAVDEAGLAGRECDLEDPDGNRLRVATPPLLTFGIPPAFRQNRRSRLALEAPSTLPLRNELGSVAAIQARQLGDRAAHGGPVGELVARG